MGQKNTEDKTAALQRQADAFGRIAVRGAEKAEPAGTGEAKRLTEVIAPAFYGLHGELRRERYTHYWLAGGRGSGKSTFAGAEIMIGMMRHPQANAVVLRKVERTLRDSVFEQMNWTMDALGVEGFWEARLSPMELRYRPTGQRILFRGADQPKKLKSTKVSQGYLRYLWFEEVDEFSGSEEIRSIIQSLMRGGERFEAFYTFNPPRSRNAWVNRELAVPREDRIVHRSDYRTVPRRWLGEQFIREAEYLRDTRPELYAHEYLGAAGETGGAVFRNIVLREIGDEEIGGFDRVRRGIDWGFGADPFVYLAVQFDPAGRRALIFHEYRQAGAAFATAAREIRKENRLCEPVTADSAEPRSNAELRERGIRVRAAKKGPGSVRHGIEWLRGLNEIVIDPVRCPGAAQEFLGYEFEPDGCGGYRDGFPDRDNHAIDAARYALERDIARPGVKI